MMQRIHYGRAGTSAPQRAAEAAREAADVDEKATLDPSTSVVRIDAVASVADGPAHLRTYIMWILPCDRGVERNGLFTLSNN